MFFCKKDLERLETPLEKEFRIKREEFQKKYNTKSTPWDDYSLDFYELESNDRVWLNPSNQNWLNSGSYTEEELRLWLDGKGPIVSGDWDELVFLLKNNLKLGWFYRNEYLWNKPEIIPSRRYEPNVKPFTNFNDSIDRIESHIKQCIIMVLRDNCSWGKTVTGYREIEFHRQHKLNDQIFGYFDALQHFGWGYFGACNTPQIRENFSWWITLLKEEASIEWKIEIGKITLEEARKYLNYKREEI